MASVYKRGESPYYYAAYFRADGSRTYRSTGCTNKAAAVEMAVGWQKAEARARKADAEMQPEIADVVTRAGREASAGQLTLDRARKHLMEIYRLATHEEFPSYSVEKWLKSWLKTNSKRVGDATMRRYQTSVTDILSSLGTGRKKDIALLTTEDVAKVQAKLSKSGTKASTTNFKMQDFKNAIRGINPNPGGFVTLTTCPEPTSKSTTCSLPRNASAFISFKKSSQEPASSIRIPASRAATTANLASLCKLPARSHGASELSGVHKSSSRW